MPRIILIETSTSLCSTALIEGEATVSYRESPQPRAHAAMTAPFVKEMLDEKGLSVRDCDAVCVSMGPGSYTGLRVGSSTAKGLCFGAGIPLLAVSTLDTLVWQAIDSGRVPEGCSAIVPMIDARRMEVYTAVYAPDGTRRTEISPMIVEEGSFADLIAEGPVLFIGDGAEKCRPVIGEANASYIGECPRADSMKTPALKAFKTGDYKDTAYFEPFYLKEFVATVSKKNLF